MDEEKLKDKLSTLEQAKLFEEISNAIASYIRCENDYSDATDGIFDTVKLPNLYKKNFRNL